MPALRKSLFIGLGGTGTKAVLNTKARLLKTYGKVPELISFLAFDTSTKDKFLTDDYGKRIELTDNKEFFYLTVDNVNDYINKNILIKQDFPLENFDYYKEGAIRDGAAQIRALGRISLIRNYNMVIQALNAAYARITNWNANTGAGAADSPVRISVVSSLAGGTGSGMFLDMAYIIRNITGLGPHDEIFAYLVLPDVYQNKPNTTQIKPNAYAAIKELEFLSDELFNPDSQYLKNFSFKYPGNIEIPVPEGTAPFDQCILINNINKSKLRFNDPDEISQLISSSLFVTIDADDKMNKVWENTYPDNLKDKRRRYMGLGIFEVVYDGAMAKKLIVLYYSKKIVETLRLIDSSITDDSNIEAKINEWKVNEYKDIDQVIERILPKVESGDIEPIEKLGKGKTEELIHKCERFLVAYKDKARKTAESNFSLILQQARESINNYIETEIVQNSSPIGTTFEFLKKLIKEFKAFQAEMGNEENEIKIKISSLSKNYDVIKKEIEKIEKRTNVPIINNVGKALVPQVENYYNLTRKEADYFKNKTKREYAQLFFSSLLTELESQKREYESMLNSTLADISNSIEEEINKIRMTRTSLPFTINLHEQLYSSITMEGANINMNDFILYLKAQNQGVEKWSNFNSDTISKIIMEFSSECIAATQSWADKTVDDILLKEFSPEKCMLTLKESYDNSSPCWELYRDEVPETNTYLICGVNNETTSIIKNHKQSDTGVTLVKQPDFFSSTSDPSRIVFLQIEHTSPAFAVRDLQVYKKEYEKNLQKKGKKLNHHANTQLQRFMDKISFDVFPFDAENINRAMGAWIIGLLFGYINKRDGDYQYKSPLKRLKENKADEWFSFETSNRKEAFEIFSQLPDLIDEFYTMYKEWVKKNGYDKFREIIDCLVVIDSSGNRSINEEKYFTEYSRFYIKHETLKGNKVYTDDLNLYAREKNFILTELETFIR